DLVKRLGRLRSPVVRLIFSDDGRRLLAAGENGTPRIWDVGSGRDVAILRAPLDLLHDAALSSDGTLVVTAGQGIARLWRVPSAGGPIASSELPGHRGFVESVAIAPQGKRLIATGDDGGTVRLWDPQTRLAQILGDLGGRIVRLAFARDGSRLVAASV